MRKPDRRAFFGLLAVGLAVTAAGCSENKPGGPGPATSSATPELPDTPEPDEPTETPSGPNQVLSKGPTTANRVAITIDDGYNDEVVAGYVDFVIRTGIHLTFSPNGLYNHAWAPHADQLKPLIERGQIQLINHTFNHRDLRRLTDAQIRDELERNEQWVSQTFGIGTRPYYRPPFGFHNEHIDGVAAELGYRNTVMWSGSYGDSTVLTPDYLMSQAQKYLEPGIILLGHANHPTVLGLFDQIMDLIRQRALNPVTLNEMFGTHAP